MTLRRRERLRAAKSPPPATAASRLRLSEPISAASAMTALQARGCGRSIFGRGVGDRLRLRIPELGYRGIAAVRRLRRSGPNRGNGQLDQIGESKPPGGDLVRPGRDLLHQERHAAEAGQHGPLRRLDARRQRNLLLAREPGGIAHLTEIGIDQAARESRGLSRHVADRGGRRLAVALRRVIDGALFRARLDRIWPNRRRAPDGDLLGRERFKGQ